MSGFLSFLSSDHNIHPLQSEEDFDMLATGVDELISVWLRQYIGIYNPGYTLEEAMANIVSSSVTNDTIAFTLNNPRTHIIERFEFGNDILDDIQKDVRFLVGRVFYESTDLESMIFSLSPATLSIIYSYHPEINPQSIIGVNIIPFDDGDEDYSAGDDYLEVYYYSPENTVEVLMLPNLSKGEHLGTNHGLIKTLNRDRRKIIELLTQKNIRR